MQYHALYQTTTGLDILAAAKTVFDYDFTQLRVILAVVVLYLCFIMALKYLFAMEVTLAH